MNWKNADCLDIVNSALFRIGLGTISNSTWGGDVRNINDNLARVLIDGHVWRNIIVESFTYLSKKLPGNEKKKLTFEEGRDDWLVWSYPGADELPHDYEIPNLVCLKNVFDKKGESVTKNDRWKCYIDKYSKKLYISNNDKLNFGDADRNELFTGSAFVIGECNTWQPLVQKYVADKLSLYLWAHRKPDPVVYQILHEELKQLDALLSDGYGEQYVRGSVK